MGRAILLQLSDPHLAEEHPEREAAFATAIERALSLDAAFDAVLVTGDVAHHGSSAEYATAARLLDAFDVPVHVVPGNMDDRGELRAAFPSVGGHGDGPVRFTAEVGGLRLIATDSTIPGEVPGQLDVEWVAQQLDAAPERPTVLTFHHPPDRVGVQAMDELGLPDADRQALAAVLRRSPQVVRVVCGHVHRPTTGVFGDRVVTTAPSVSYAFGLSLGDVVPLGPTPEPRGLSVHVWDGGTVVTHVVSI